MEKYKSFEKLKKELEEKYDKYMYDMNLELIEQKESSIDFIKTHGDRYIKNDSSYVIYTIEEIENLLKILGDEDYE